MGRVGLLLMWGDAADLTSQLVSCLVVVERVRSYINDTTKVNVLSNND